MIPFIFGYRETPMGRAEIARWSVKEAEGRFGTVTHVFLSFFFFSLVLFGRSWELNDDDDDDIFALIRIIKFKFELNILLCLRIFPSLNVYIYRWLYIGIITRFGYFLIHIFEYLKLYCKNDFKILRYIWFVSNWNAIENVNFNDLISYRWVKE